MRFRLLGSVMAHNEHGPVPLGPARQRTVAAVLLTELGTAVAFDQLIDRVWGQAPPQRARETLHTYLSRLRSVLGDTQGQALIRRARSYTLEADPAAVDLHRFRTLAEQARSETHDHTAARLWSEALGLWQGAPFADLDNDWLRAIATSLEAERLAALVERNDLLLRGGEHARLLPELTAVAAAHPLDERLAGQLMLALYLSGRQADGLAHYRQVHDLLVGELGSDPGPALRDLHHQILRQDPVLVANATDSLGSGSNPDAPSQLPADIAGFTGREAALSQLDAVLGCPGDPPSTMVISTIGGCGGIGKTALAVHWAHRVRDRFPDGQLYLNLRGFDPGGQAMSPSEALRALLELLGVAPRQIPASVEAQAGIYRGRLAGAKMLVLLDNARDAEQIRPLLPGSAGSMALITSRNDLASLVAAEGARPIWLDALDAEQARLLLAARLGPDRLAAEPEAVDEIVAACAGLPLALAIVAARAATRPALPMSAFAAELADAGRRLDAFSGPDAATDVRAVMSWSYHALPATAARLFRLLGLHPGPDISVTAAASLADLPSSHTRELLNALAAAHMVTENSPGRYTLHDLIRAYAAELARTIDPEPDRRAATSRMLDHYVHTSHTAAKLINPRPTPVEPGPALPGAVVTELSSHVDADAWFRTERQTLLACVEQAAGTGHNRHSWHLAWAMGDYLERRGRWADVLAGQHTALTAARRLGELTMQAVAHQGLGLNYSRLGRHHEAGTHLRESIRLNASLGRHRGLMGAHLAMAVDCDRQGLHHEALDHNRLALGAAQAAGELSGQVGCLNGIGWQLAQLGRYDDSIAYCERALAVPIAHDHRFHADTWDTLGFAHQRLTRHEQAIACFERAVALFGKLGVRLYEAESLTRLADSHEALGDEPAARAARTRALGILDEIGHPDAERLRKQLE
ncbi:AfsR/SARP family transcriptional regulator [Allorhizocola rhizosphaerae]|uniref:AfsR/SARP family transcriptional regulator n=1 Tax=Allorhizocola rhizosphaerae TaxID=1872709 RepID=UPI0013C2F0EF|nr:BTAD domain-containing putative transcriptional regulator [Allorhizocola rhizosphaerae]